MKKITMESFVDVAWDDEVAGIYHTGDGLFALKCSTGCVEFEPGRTSIPLPDILILAREAWSPPPAVGVGRVGVTVAYDQTLRLVAPFLVESQPL